MDIVSSSKLWVQDKINMNNVLDELFQTSHKNMVGN
jgi:hypothetical protein